MTGPTRPCPACASTDVGERRTLRELMFGLDEHFDYLVCAGCATLFIATVPADLADYYTSKYYSFDLDPQAVMGRPGVMHAVRRVARAVLLGSDQVARNVATILGRPPAPRQVQTLVMLLQTVRTAGLVRGADSRVLDVGSGSGALVYAMGLAGLREVTGVDPFNEDDRTFDSGAQVLRRELSEVTGAYDLVMLHHSLEHVPDPAETLEQTRRLLAPGGRVLVRMPTVSSEACRRYGPDWIQLDPPRHLTLLSRSGVEMLCRRVGLDVLGVHDDSTEFQFWGSEQARAGVPLVSATSRFTHPEASPFTRRQIVDWRSDARRLNAAGDGDQAIWVLAASTG